MTEVIATPAGDDLALLEQRIDLLCARLRLPRRTAREVHRLTRQAAVHHFYYYERSYWIARQVAARFAWGPPELDAYETAVKVFTPILNGAEPTREQLEALAERGRQGALVVRRLTKPTSDRLRRTRLNEVDLDALEQRIDELAVRLGLVDDKHWSPVAMAKFSVRNGSPPQWSPAERAARSLVNHLEMQSTGSAHRMSAWKRAAWPVLTGILEERALSAEELTWLLRSESPTIRSLAGTTLPLPDRDRTQGDPEDSLGDTKTPSSTR